MSDYVLVVDDHPEVRRLIIDVLHYLELEGRAVASGEDAVALVQTDPPTAIVLDLMMPGMDGFSTITRLHKEAKGSPIPIILLSAIAQDDERLTGLPGVASVIRKDNFTVDTFGKLLDTLLKKKRPASPLLDEEEIPAAKFTPAEVETPAVKFAPAYEEETPAAKFTPAEEDKPASIPRQDGEAQPDVQPQPEEAAKPGPGDAKDSQPG
jgi:CheY-like chemotaxis protein